MQGNIERINKTESDWGMKRFEDLTKSELST